MDDGITEFYEVPIIAGILLMFMALLETWIQGARLVRTEGLMEHYRRSDGISHATHGGHVVVLDAAGSRYYGLDQVGARIWDLLASQVSADEIVERIVAEYDAPRGLVQADVHTFLDQMVDARLVAVEKRA